jgi:hypothetical protein
MGFLIVEDVVIDGDGTESIKQGEFLSDGMHFTNQEPSLTT